jgi:hypothetical protein
MSLNIRPRTSVFQNIAALQAATSSQGAKVTTIVEQIDQLQMIIDVLSNTGGNGDGTINLADVPSAPDPADYVSTFDQNL